MKKTKLSIVIPCHNEAANIEPLYKEIYDTFKKRNEKIELVFINDGSKDATRSICQNRGYNFLDLPINLGIGGAVQTGYKYAQRNDYEIAIQIDGDGQHDVSQLSKVIKPLEKGEADIVIGSRFIEKEGFQASRTRRFGIRFLSGLIFICTGRKIRDVTSGYRAVNRRFIEIYADNYPNDYPEPEAIVAAVMHRGKIKEVPVVMQERQNGTSSIHAWKSVYYMVKVTLAIIVCRISFGVRR